MQKNVKFVQYEVTFCFSFWGLRSPLPHIPYRGFTPRPHVQVITGRLPRPPCRPLIYLL